MFTKETFSKSELEKHMDYAADYIFAYNHDDPIALEFKGRLSLAIVDLAERIISDATYAIVDEATMSYLSLKYKIEATEFSSMANIEFDPNHNVVFVIVSPTFARI